MKDKVQRINFEAFSAASALSQALRPRGSASPLATNYSNPVQKLFAATTDVLADSNVDADVRERALETLGSLLVYEGDVLQKSYSVCLPLITARLSSENTASIAIQVIGKIAESPLCQGQAFDKWLLDVLPEAVVALRRNRRSSEFTCLQSLLGRIGTKLPRDVADGIVVHLSPFIDTPTALQTVALILIQQPASRSAVEGRLLPQVLETVHTPSVNINLADGLVAFFGAFVEGDVRCAPGLVRSLMERLKGLDRIPDATAGGTSVFQTTGRCVGVVVERSGGNAGGEVIKDFRKVIDVRCFTPSHPDLPTLTGWQWMWAEHHSWLE